jgi:hypothetical protein
MFLIFPMIMFGVVLGVLSSIYYLINGRNEHGGLAPHGNWIASHKHEFFTSEMESQEPDLLDINIDIEKKWEPPYYPDIEE